MIEAPRSIVQGNWFYRDSIANGFRALTVKSTHTYVWLAESYRTGHILTQEETDLNLLEKHLLYCHFESIDNLFLEISEKIMQEQWDITAQSSYSSLHLHQIYNGTQITDRSTMCKVIEAYSQCKREKNFAEIAISQLIKKAPEEWQRELNELATSLNKPPEINWEHHEKGIKRRRVDETTENA